MDLEPVVIKGLNRKKIKSVFMESSEVAKFLTILVTFSRKNLAYLGKERLVEDRLRRVVFFPVPVPKTW